MAEKLLTVVCGHYLARMISRPGMPYSHIDTCRSRRCHDKEGDRTASSSCIAVSKHSPNLIFSSGLKDIFSWELLSCMVEYQLLLLHLRNPDEKDDEDKKWTI